MDSEVEAVEFLSQRLRFFETFSAKFSSLLVSREPTAPSIPKPTAGELGTADAGDTSSSLRLRLPVLSHRSISSIVDLRSQRRSNSVVLSAGARYQTSAARRALILMF